MKNLILIDVPKNHIKIEHYYDGTAIITTFKNVREIDTRYTKFYKADVSIIKLPASFVKKLSHEKLIEVVSKDFDFYYDLGIVNE